MKETINTLLSSAAARRLLSPAVAFIRFLVVVVLVAIALAAMQVALIGGLDRLGVAPQHSFLALNVTLIALLAAFRLYPQVYQWPVKQQDSAVRPGSRHAKTGSSAPRAELICKLLMIRRLNNAKGDQNHSVQVIERGSKTNAVATTN